MDWWYPPHPNTPQSLADLRVARSVCARCVVDFECLAAAIEANEAWGWWGGMKPKHRAKLRSRTMTPVEWRIGRPQVRPVNTAGTAA